MHTAEPELHPLAYRLPRPLRNLRFLRSEDTVLATLASWTVGLGIFTLVGFYFGTIAGHANHPVADPSATTSIGVANGTSPEAWRAAGRQLHQDLDPAQLIAAWPYALGGLIVGILFASYVSFVYVPHKLRELEAEQAASHH